MFMNKLRKSVKPLMWLVAVGFVSSLFFTYSRMSSREGEKPLVEVNGEKIAYLDFAQAYRNAYDRYVEATGGPISLEVERYLRSQVLSQLVSNELLYQEVKKTGIKVSDEEIKGQVEQIMRSFGSRENFMQYLAYMRIEYSDFEQSLRRQISTSKLTQLLRSSVIVTEKEIESYWVVENESVDLAYLFLDPKKYITDIKVDPEEAKKYYEENKEGFEIPEKVQIEYILISPDEFKDEVKVSQEDLENYYQEYSDEFQIEEKRRASHILIGISPDAEEEAKNEAQERIQEVRQKLEEGVDFAELAQEYSDDKVSGERGGDLEFFTYDAMTLEFSKAVFSLQEIGDLSDIVETPYGLHLIKLTGIELAYEKSFEEVKDEIKEALFKEKEENLAHEEIQEVMEKIEKGELSFEKYAKEYPSRAKITPLFARYEELEALSWNFNFDETAFSLEADKISSPLRIEEGWCIMGLKDKKPPYIPDWDEAQNEAVEKVAQEKAEKITAQRAGDIAKRVKEGEEELGFFAQEWEYRTQNLITRENPIQEIFGNDKDRFLQVAFSLPQGKVSDPLFLSNGYYIIKIVEIKVPWEKFPQEKDIFGDELLIKKKEELLENWFSRISERAKIVDNTSLFFDFSS